MTQRPAPAVDAGTWHRHSLLNRAQSLLLLATLAGFMALLGWMFWGRSGMLAMLAVAALFVLINPSVTPRLVMRMYGALRVRPDAAPELDAIIRELARRADLPAVPALYYVPSRMHNAFAIGSPRDAALAVTDGLVRGLTPRELVGVLAHEIAHVANNDLWVMGLADMMSRQTSLLSLFGQLLLLVNLPLMLGGGGLSWMAILLLIFAPQISALAQLALSRTREFHADLNAARLTGDPEGLAAALAKIDRATSSVWERIFLPGRRVPEPSLLRTHPPVEQRIERLLSLVGEHPAEPTWPVSGDSWHGPRTIAGPVTRSPRWHLNGLWH